MALKDLPRKLKAIRVRGFLTRGQSSKEEPAKKPSWMMPISHGFHVVNRSLISGSDDSESDLVVVQREQIEDLEVWLFGVSDAQMGHGVAKYLQSHLFDKNLNESQIRKKSKETMKKAYLSTRAKMYEGKQEDENLTEGSTSAIVIHGEKIVTANMGNYRAVICRDGVANQICGRNGRSPKKRWSLNLISGALRMRLGNTDTKPSRSSEPAVGVEKIDSDTEFVILASNGIWEVMKNQEAVNLIMHINDPQEAAECLAKEALTRMSKGNISCLVIRLDL